MKEIDLRRLIVSIASTQLTVFSATVGGVPTKYENEDEKKFVAHMRQFNSYADPT